jgi:serine/threonine-protein kinase
MESRGDTARFVVSVPMGYEDHVGNHTLALSPDGRMLVYGTEGRLYIKAVDEFEGKPLIGTDGAAGPFFSPDGMWLGFTQGGTLKKLPINGGSSIEIARGIGTNLGSSWDENGLIVYAPIGSYGLMRVSSNGGLPEQITTVDAAATENSHHWPQVLPGGDLVMYTVIGPSGGWDDAKIVVHDIGTGRRVTVRERATSGKYLPTGHLIYAQATGTLVAAPFDLGRREVIGSPVPVQSGVRLAIWGGSASYAVSDNGTLAIILGSIHASMSLQWVDREGRSLRRLGGAMLGAFVNLSPNGSRIAADVRQPNNSDIFLIDAITGEQSRFTFLTPEDESPIWSPDGRRLAYSSAWTGQERRIFVKPVDAATEPTLLYSRASHMHLSSWSPDGRWLVFDDIPEYDIWALKVDSTEQLVAVTTGDDAAYGARFSPNGRWLAYTSNETGRNEVYVVPFPPEPAVRHQVSVDGGRNPVWARNGGELFFRSGDTLMAVSVSIEGNFVREGPPRALFVAPGLAWGLECCVFGRNYDAAPDGTRFVIRTTDADAVVKEVHIVQNWLEELKAKVGN